MANDKLQMIRDLHAFTEAGISKCKRALDDADSDFFQALCTLLSPAAFREKDQAFQVRSMGGETVRDPVTKEEADLMDRLRNHFAAASVRPHHVLFSTEVLPSTLFADPAHFERLTSPMGESWLLHLWNASGDHLSQEYRLVPDGLRVSSVGLDGDRKAAVINLPQTESEQEPAYIVVSQRRKRFRLIGRAHPLRYFLVLEPIRAPDWNIVVVEECLPAKKELGMKKHFDRENVETSAESLAALVDEIR